MTINIIIIIIILTIIDRFSCFAEALPIADITAATVTKEFYQYFARYGVVSEIVTDRGSQFRSEMFKNFLKNLGIKHIETLSYSPRTNGKVETIHRQLKSSLRANPRNWTLALMGWLMMIRNTYRPELKCTPAEVVYGEPVRLPVDLLHTTEIKDLDPASYVDKIRTSITKIIPKFRKVDVNGYIDMNLMTCDKVFVRNMSKTGLQSVYMGPYKVISRSDTFFTVMIKNKAENIKIDRLKTAYLMDEETFSKVNNDDEKFCNQNNQTSPSLFDDIILRQNQNNERENEQSNNDQTRRANEQPNTEQTRTEDEQYDAEQRRHDETTDVVRKKLPKPWFFGKRKNEGIQGPTTRSGRQTYSGSRFQAGFK